MNLVLNTWCLALSIIFTITYLSFGLLIIFGKYKPRIAKYQILIIILILVNLVAKNVGFGII